MLDRGLFFGFVPVGQLDAPDPDRWWIGTAGTAVEHAVALTTNAGLWCYVLGDRVTLVNLPPQRLLVTGRTSFTLNTLGEHLAAHELNLAVAETARAAGADIVDYASGAAFPDAGSARGGYVFMVGLTSHPRDAEALAQALDASLLRPNADYADHRRQDFGMLPPKVHLTTAGRFAGWMERPRRLNGQNKVPQVDPRPGVARRPPASRADILTR